MIKLISMSALIIWGCGAVKSNQSQKENDSTVINRPIKNDLQDTLISQVPGQFKLPTCIKNKIDSFKLKDVAEKPQRVVEYMYKGKKVYYLVMPCCDFFNEVYDDKCHYLGAPNGGFTGTGDGKLPDFFTEAKNERLVWGTPK